MNDTREQKTHALKRRSIRTGPFENEINEGDWFAGRPYTTQMLNAYTLLVPGGEKFVIRSCQHFLKDASLELKDELQHLFFQEGSHSREHERLLKAMQARRIDTKGFRALVDIFAYRILEPITPKKLRLSTAAAIEHHNAIISTYFLQQNLLKDVSPSEMRRLLLWHFCEEIEHKETVFKLMMSTNTSCLTRSAGMFFSITTFLAYLFIGSMILSFKTGAIKHKGFWRNLAHEAFSKYGIGRVLFSESLSYLKPKFYPNLAESQPLLTIALAELEQLNEEKHYVE